MTGAAVEKYRGPLVDALVGTGRGDRRRVARRRPICLALNLPIGCAVAVGVGVNSQSITGEGRKLAQVFCCPEKSKEPCEGQLLPLKMISGAAVASST